MTELRSHLVEADVDRLGRVEGADGRGIGVAGEAAPCSLRLTGYASARTDVRIPGGRAARPTRLTLTVHNTVNVRCGAGRSRREAVEERLHPGGREDHEDAGGLAADVLEGVLGAARDEHERAGRGLAQLTADPEAQAALDHVPVLVLAGVSVHRRPVAGSDLVLDGRQETAACSPRALNVSGPPAGPHGQPLFLAQDYPAGRIRHWSPPRLAEAPILGRGALANAVTTRRLDPPPSRCSQR